MYALGQFGWSLGSYGVLNLLQYFYNPPVQNGTPVFPIVIGSAGALGIIASAGRLFDAVTDPLIAGWSDRSRRPRGRRIPFMARALLPFVILSILVFTPPRGGGEGVVLTYLALTTFLFFFFMTMYVTPFFALLSELGHSPEERLQLSTLISITWALGFMTGSQVYAIQAAFETSLPPAGAFRWTLGLFAALSAVLMALPVLFIDERRYSDHQPSEEGSFAAVRSAFANRDFRVFALSDLTYWLALTFVQTGISYYVVLLLELPTETASSLLAILFLASFLFYVPVSLVARRTGKKPLMVVAFVLFVLVNGFMLLWGVFPGPPMVYGVGGMVLAALPLAIFGILPNAIVGDIAEDDARRTGHHKGGVYFGARTFMQKVGVSITVFLFPVLSRIGGAPGQVGAAGVRATLAASGIGLLAGLVLFLRYREADLLSRLRESRSSDRVPSPDTTPGRRG